MRVLVGIASALMLGFMLAGCSPADPLVENKRLLKRQNAHLAFYHLDDFFDDPKPFNVQIGQHRFSIPFMLLLGDEPKFRADDSGRFRNGTDGTVATYKVLFKCCRVAKRHYDLEFGGLGVFSLMIYDRDGKGLQTTVDKVRQEHTIEDLMRKAGLVNTSDFSDIFFELRAVDHDENTLHLLSKDKMMFDQQIFVACNYDCYIYSLPSKAFKGTGLNMRAEVSAIRWADRSSGVQSWKEETGIPHGIICTKEQMRRDALAGRAPRGICGRPTKEQIIASLPDFFRDFNQMIEAWGVEDE